MAIGNRPAMTLPAEMDKMSMPESTTTTERKAPPTSIKMNDIIIEAEYPFG